MGSIGSLFGTQGSANGTGFASPQAAPIQMPVSTAQAQNANAQTQNLLAALQGQGGIGNQSQIYNQLQQVAAGQGPNPAQAMLNQATGQNVANQAALMAGQRGASQNAGLIARQAAQQGAATQQQAVGQGAAMQAQQSLNALGQAGNLATTQAQQQIGATQANQQALLNAIAAQNNANVGMQSNVNQANAGLAGTAMQGQQGLVGGLLGGAGAALGLARGGEVLKHFDQGGNVSGPQSMFMKYFNQMGQYQAPGSSSILNQGANQMGQAIGTGIKNMFQSQGSPASASTVPQDYTPGGFTMSNQLARGGDVPAMVSPGEIYLSPKAVEQVRKGADPMKVGEKIPGKARVKGAKNSYANDTVKRTLKEGGIVVPRSETKSESPSRNSKKFVDGVMAKRRARGAA